MHIALIGYGKMGHEVETQAVARGHTVLPIVNADDLHCADFQSIDIAIDFTESGAVLENLSLLSQKKKNVVIGTTGWYDKLSSAQQVVVENGTGCLWSANFSIGVNLYYRILEATAKLVNLFPVYDVFAHEFHHALKKDSPSGTALKIGEILLKNMQRKTTLVTDCLNRPPLPQELHMSSTRGGSVPGTHSVFFDSPADTIELTHTARNRSGFALGAVLAAEWLAQKNGFFTMDDFLNDLFSSLKSRNDIF